MSRAALARKPLSSAGATAPMLPFRKALADSNLLAGALPGNRGPDGGRCYLPQWASLLRARSANISSV
jgi:hypothetical protein